MGVVPLHYTTQSGQDSRHKLTHRKKIFFDQLLARIDQRRAIIKASHPDKPMVACWDFDGTILQGDITEGLVHPAACTYVGMMDHLLRADLVPGFTGPQGEQRLWEEYQRLGVEEGTTAAFVFLAEVFAELTPEQLQRIDALLDPLVPGYYARYIMEESLYLIEALNRRQVRQFIISASPHLFVCKGARLVPIPPAQVSGIDRRRHNGKLLDELINHDKGKKQRAEAIVARLGGVPLFAAGNRWHSDGAMLELVCRAGGVGLMINGGSAPDWAEELGVVQWDLATVPG